MSIAFIRHDSRRPVDEAEEIIRFAYAQTGGIDGSIAIWFKREHRDEQRGYRGYARDGERRKAKWQRRARFSISLQIPADPWRWYGRPHICGHADAWRTNDTLPAAVAAAHAAGQARYGRWPIRRRQGTEVQCEEFSARVLNAWRLEQRYRYLAAADAGPPGHDLTNATGEGMVLVPDDPKEVTMSTATLDKPATETGNAAGDTGDGKTLDEQLRDEITPIKGATIVKAGGRTVEKKKETGGGSSKTRAGGKRAGGKRTAAKATKKKSDRISAIAAAEIVLQRAHGPLHVHDITERILAMPGTGLKGKTPEASVGAILAVNAKKRDSVFKRTAPSTYTLKAKK